MELPVTAQMTAESARYPAKFLWLRVFPPVYFIALAWLRCYVETALLAQPPFFSYYIVLQHILWVTMTMLVIILLAHAILRVPVQNLLWLMYGGTVMLIPLIYALIFRTPLELNYLRGSLSEITAHIVTFCATYPCNLPLTIELVAIFLGMGIIGYIYTREWRSALGLAIAVHIMGNVLAIEWFGAELHSKGIFIISTRLTNHPLLAIIFLYAVSLLVILLLWRGGQLNCDRRLMRPIAWALGAWIGCAIAAWGTGWFEYGFDCVAAGLPCATGAFLIALFLQRARNPLSPWTWLCLCVLILVQLAVFLPIFLHLETCLSPFPHPPYTNGVAG